jgi:hypothetical protein
VEVNGRLPEGGDAVAPLGAGIVDDPAKGGVGVWLANPGIPNPLPPGLPSKSTIAADRSAAKPAIGTAPAIGSLLGSNPN